MIYIYIIEREKQTTLQGNDMSYQERCKIVSVAKSKSSNNYYVVCQSSKCIEDTNNPFNGQKKMHVIKADKVYMQTLLGLWKFERLGKLIGKQVILRLEHNPYSCFDKVTGVCKDQSFAFRAIPQTIPNFVLEDAGIIIKGEML